MSLPPSLQHGSVLTQTKLADIPSFTPIHQIGPSIAPGVVLLGRFQLIEEIGAGGMGRVFSAWDTLRESHVAIKVLTDLMMSHETAQKRFMTEASISMQLSHSNIVRVFDIQQDMGLTFIVMELLSGYSLRQWMVYYQQNNSRFEVAEVKRIGGAILEALSVAHEVTVHRDIKPENIFVNGDGLVKLMDFGIARDLGPSALTHTTLTVGTAYYMAPEQLSASRNVDARADIYALGIVLYEMLTGVVPTGMAQGIKRFRPDVSGRLARVVEKALAPLPEQRYEDAAAFRLALESEKIPGESWWAPGRVIGKSGLSIGAGVLAIAVLAIGVTTLAGGVNGGWLYDNMPVFGEAAEKLHVDVATYEAEVKDLHRSLESVRNAASRDANKVYSRLVGDVVLSSAEWARLEAASQVAAAAVREKSYRKALRLLGDSKKQHEEKLAAVKLILPALERIDAVRQLVKTTGAPLQAGAAQALDEAEGGKLFAPFSEPNGTGKGVQALKELDGVLLGEQQRLGTIAMQQMEAKRKRDEEARQVAAAQEKQRQAAEMRRREEEMRQREAMEQQRRRDAEVAALRQREADAVAQRQRDAELNAQRQRDAEAAQRRQREANAQREAESQRQQAAAQEREERAAANARRKEEACSQASIEVTTIAAMMLLCVRKGCPPDVQRQLDDAKRKMNRLC